MPGAGAPPPSDGSGLNDPALGATGQPQEPVDRPGAPGVGAQPPAGLDSRDGGSALVEPSVDYETIRRILQRAVGRSCPKRLLDHRDDIVQAALVKVMEIARGGEQRAVHLASYLWRVAHSALVDEIRRLERRHEVALDEIDLLEAGRMPAIDPQEPSTRREVGAQIEECLRQLAEPRRLAVVLHLHGFTSEESSRTLGWNVKRIRNLVFRGLEGLRRCLERKGIRP